MYDDAFYGQITAGSLRSASKVVPKVLEIFNAKSVIDLGCGTGAWLSVFEEHGLTVRGVDGDYVNPNQLLIDPIKFLPLDLVEPFPDFLNLKADLAMSLEVAEHLPPEAADEFVAKLCAISNNILFSAAVPGQNGVNHINERWPSYWVPKFEALGYTCSSNFRFEFWHDEDVENWYRQNILLFSKCDSDSRLSDGMYLKYFTGPQILDVIHYNNWNGKI